MAGHVTLRPVEGFVEVLIVTFPTKLLRLLMVNVITALFEPGAKLTRLVLEYAKSPTWTVAVAECVALPVDATPVIVKA